MLPDAHRAPPPPRLRRRAPHPDPAPHPRLHRRRPAHEHTSTPASSSWEVFFGEALAAPRSTPAAAGQRRPEAPSRARWPAGRTSYADVVRLCHSYAARGQPPPTYQLKPAFTARRSNSVDRPRRAATTTCDGSLDAPEEPGWTHVTRRKGCSGGAAPDGFRRHDPRCDAHSWRGRAPPPSSRPPTAALLTFNRATQGRCFICLGKGHWAAACRDPIYCFRCRRSGHRERDCSRRRIPQPPVNSSPHQTPSPPPPSPPTTPPPPPPPLPPP
jgi:hypothetical protein